MEHDINLLSLHRKVLEIRIFEESLLKMYDKGLLRGTVHTSLGQEAVAVGLLSNAIKGDSVFSSHRCHGHYIANGGDLKSLFLEIMGNKDGICGGIGGSQHINNNDFFSNGVQGSYMPISVGLALGKKINNNNNIAISFIGDGTLGQGVVYEALNMASLYEVPLLIALENNGWAQTTSIENNFSGNIAERCRGFNILPHEINGSDVEALYSDFRSIIEKVRKEKKPVMAIINTYRLGPHSKGDDTREKKYIDEIKKNDPLLISKKKCGEFQEIEESVKKEISNILNEIGVKI